MVDRYSMDYLGDKYYQKFKWQKVFAQMYESSVQEIYLGMFPFIT
jgi:hypothetical protein